MKNAIAYSKQVKWIRIIVCMAFNQNAQSVDMHTNAHKPNNSNDSSNNKE